MTKQNKTICLDIEIINKLNKTKSASNLINELLKEHFNSGNGLKEKELQSEMNKKKLEREKLNKEIEETENKLKKIKEDKERVKETYKNIPKEILDDFRSFRDMDIHSLRDRFNEYYNKKYKDLNLNEIEKAFKEFKGIKDE